MDKIYLTLAFLACVGHGRRLQTDFEQFQITHPSVAFHPSGNPARGSLQPRRPDAVPIASVRMDSSESAPSVTINVKKKDKSSAAPAADESEPAATKITVRKKSKSDGDDSSKISSTATAIEEEDDTVTTVVKVKAPTPDQEAPAQIAGAGDPEDALAGLTQSEQDLLEGSQRGNCTLILEALQDGANPNILDPQGRTPLHFVAGLGVAPAVVLLLHFGAQIDVSDEQGLTPLHMAAGYANIQTLKVLLGSGADMNIASPTQGTPLQIVINRGNFQLNQFYERQGLAKITKKKDEKLDELKACLWLFDNLDRVKEQHDWDEMLKEVLTFVQLQREKEKK